MSGERSARDSPQPKLYTRTYVDGWHFLGDIFVDVGDPEGVERWGAGSVQQLPDEEKPKRPHIKTWLAKRLIWRAAATAVAFTAIERRVCC